MGDPRRALGAMGEREAEAHMRRMGFAILERNYRTRYGELSLVADNRAQLVFADVKTRIGGRTNTEFFEPVTHGPDKTRRMRAMASLWLADNREPGGARTLRFDAISVTVSATGRLLDLQHVEAAY